MDPEVYQAWEDRLANLEDDYQAALEIGADELAAIVWADIQTLKDRLAAMSEMVVARRQK